MHNWEDMYTRLFSCGQPREGRFRLHSSYRCEYSCAEVTLVPALVVMCSPVEDTQEMDRRQSQGFQTRINLDLKIVWSGWLNRAARRRQEKWNDWKRLIHFRAYS